VRGVGGITCRSFHSSLVEASAASARFRWRRFLSESTAQLLNRGREAGRNELLADKTASRSRRARAADLPEAMQRTSHVRIRRPVERAKPD